MWLRLSYPNFLGLHTVHLKKQTPRYIRLFSDPDPWSHGFCTTSSSWVGQGHGRADEVLEPPLGLNQVTPIVSATYVQMWSQTSFVTALWSGNSKPKLRERLINVILVYLPSRRKSPWLTCEHLPLVLGAIKQTVLDKKALDCRAS